MFQISKKSQKQIRNDDLVDDIKKWMKQMKDKMKKWKQEKKIKESKKKESKSSRKTELASPQTSNRESNTVENHSSPPEDVLRGINLRILQFEERKRELEEIIRRNQEDDLDKEEEEVDTEEEKEDVVAVIKKEKEMTKENIQERKSNELEPQSDSICLLCCDAEIAITFIPCCHRCCCFVCSLRVETCPLCRADIEIREDDRKQVQVRDILQTKKKEILCV